MRDPNMEEKLQTIEKEIEQAKVAKSISGEICKWVGSFSAIFGTIIALAISYQTADKRAFFAVAGFLGTGLPLAAIGSNATSNKKAAKAAIIQTQIAKLSYFDPGCDTVG